MLRGLSIGIGGILMTILGSACTAPKFDGSTPAGKAAIIDATNLALSGGDCSSAVAAIEDLYNSSNSDDQVRMIRASAQGCAAGVTSFFKTLGDIAQNAGSLGGAGLWPTASKLFWETDTNTLDKRITAGGFATDALQAVLKSGAIVATANQVGGGAYNPGSTLATDRTDDANLYMIFIALSQMGALQNRYGAPNASTFGRGQILAATGSTPDGWTKATQVDANACAYAGAILNLVDSINAIAANLSGGTQSNFTKITTAFGSVIGLACNAGCKGGTLNTISYAITGCTFTDDNCTGTSSFPCPMSLRNRNSCTGAVSDRATCAAAGIANFISKDVLGWQP